MARGQRLSHWKIWPTGADAEVWRQRRLSWERLHTLGKFKCYGNAYMVSDFVMSRCYQCSSWGLETLDVPVREVSSHFKYFFKSVLLSLFLSPCYCRVYWLAWLVYFQRFGSDCPPALFSSLPLEWNFCCKTKLILVNRKKTCQFISDKINSLKTRLNCMAL